MYDITLLTCWTCFQLAWEGLNWCFGFSFVWYEIAPLDLVIKSPFWKCSTWSLTNNCVNKPKSIFLLTKWGHISSMYCKSTKFVLKNKHFQDIYVCVFILYIIYSYTLYRNRSRPIEDTLLTSQREIYNTGKTFMITCEQKRSRWIHILGKITCAFQPIFSVCMFWFHHMPGKVSLLRNSIRALVKTG